jgi:hypothetical protein
MQQKLPRHSPPWTVHKQRMLMEQVNDTHPRIRAIAAANPRVNGTTLLWLMQDPELEVRRAAVKNPTATRAMWQIVRDYDTDPGMVAYARMMLGGIQHAKTQDDINAH